MTSACLSCIATALVLLLSANGAPILADKLLRRRYARPIDGGLRLGDGHPLFGAAKTWRGLIASAWLTASIGWLLGLPALLGGLFALFSMSGDLTASFLKRRIGKIESSRARGFDTLPESVLPTYLMKDALALSTWDIALVAIAFFLMEEFGSPLLYKWHIRRRPY
ncbi:MAG: CDP-archaeol synthase [Methylomonas sp.]|nr:CDP-archaeol synthase [Methylomonas sp.]